MPYALFKFLSVFTLAKLLFFFLLLSLLKVWQRIFCVAVAKLIDFCVSNRAQYIRKYSQYTDTLYIHTFTICILQPNRPNYQSWSRRRSQANDKWHDVICAKSLIDTHESCCGSSSGEVPRPPPVPMLSTTLDSPTGRLLRVTLSAVWYPARQRQAG